MLVKFDVSGDPSAIDRSDPATTIPRFKQVPGLGFKAFIADRSRGIVGGFYVWDSRDAMERFLSSGGLARAEATFGVKPSIETFDVSAVMNGAAALAVA